MNIVAGLCWVRGGRCGRERERESVDAMPSRRVGGLSFSAGTKHSVALSSETHSDRYRARTTTTTRIHNYKLLAASKEDLSSSDLYHDLPYIQPHVRPRAGPVRSKLNHCDGFSDLSRGRTKSECMIRRSREIQNMFVLPLNQNIPSYPSQTSKPIPPSTSTSSYLLGRDEVTQYQGFRPVQARHFRQTTWTSLGYQVRSALGS